MKKLFALIASLVIIATLSGCNSQPKMGSGDKVLATSGSDKILLRDFLYNLGTYRTQNEYYFNQQLQLTAEDFKEYWNAESAEGEGRIMFDDLKDYALESAKEIAVLYRLATNQGFTYDESQIQTVKENLDSAVMSMNSPEKTGDRVFYENYYVTKEEALEVAKIINVAEVFESSIRDSITVTDDDIKAFYDDPANFDLIEDIRNVTVAHILIESAEDASDEEKDAAKKEADDILARIQAGENFGEMAARYSSDPGSKDNNGEYVITRNENFVPEFMDWTFSAEVGDYGIVETSYGFHIMNLVRVDEFEDMIDQLREMTVSTKVDAEIDRLIAENPMEWEVDQELFKSILPDVYGKPYEGRQES